MNDTHLVKEPIVFPNAETWCGVTINAGIPLADLPNTATCVQCLANATEAVLRACPRCHGTGKGGLTPISTPRWAHLCLVCGGTGKRP